MSDTEEIDGRSFNSLADALSICLRQSQINDLLAGVLCNLAFCSRTQITSWIWASMFWILVFSGQGSGKLFQDIQSGQNYRAGDSASSDSLSPGL
ncbi:unnamed protein product [Ilex paraguariensis]|uniref:Uncharacterized protein n=1 Tax=Ilex paraguariensis TaxID=185542 RepID=A0ABC8SAB0_9AQUA